MANRLLKPLALAALLISLSFSIVPLGLAADAATADSASTSQSDSKNAKDAASPSECATNDKNLVPSNCLFLEEPIGGEPGYDLYIRSCKPGDICRYVKYNGGQINTAFEHGPMQAILTREAGKTYQGPFGLLYNYMGLIYKYISGVIVGFAVLMVIIGGIEISIGGAVESTVNSGKGHIKKALLGLVVWFTASIILYTINPTFFTF